MLGNRFGVAHGFRLAVVSGVDRMNGRATCVFSLVMALFSCGALAQYRCVENGKAVFTDRPCGDEPKQTMPTGNAPKVIGDAGNSAYSSPYGDWRGDAQFQARLNGAVVQDAHTVGPMTISISPQGKVQGFDELSGCKLKGVASPFVGPNSLSIDVTFSGCRYSGYNKRMSGYLHLNPTQRVAMLNLNGFVVAPFGTKNESYDIRATLRR
jgi:hypothetical protein